MYTLDVQSYSAAEYLQVITWNGRCGCIDSGSPHQPEVSAFGNGNGIINKLIPY